MGGRTGFESKTSTQSRAASMRDVWGPRPTKCRRGPPLNIIPSDPPEILCFPNPTILGSAAPIAGHSPPKTRRESHDITICDCPPGTSNICAKGPAGDKSSHHPCTPPPDPDQEEVGLLFHRMGRGYVLGPQVITWAFSRTVRSLRHTQRPDTQTFRPFRGEGLGNGPPKKAIQTNTGTT